MRQKGLWDESEPQRDSRSPRPDDEVRAARLQRAIRAYGVTPELLRHVAEGGIREEAVWGIHARTLTPELDGLRRLVAGLFRPLSQQRIRTSDDIGAWLLAETAGAVQEELWTVGVSTKHAIVCAQRVYCGSLNACTVRIAEVLRPALLANASQVIVAHNHPSGDATPSPEDLVVMRQIGEAADLLDCELLDFIVLGQGRWTSMYKQSAAASVRKWYL